VTDKALIGSVGRALDILDVFARHRGWVGVTEVSRELTLSFATTHHLVATLAHYGYLERDPRTRKYRLGIKLVEIGLSAVDEMPLPRAAQPVMDDLSMRLNESVNLAILDGNEVVYVGQSSTNRLVTFFTRLGQRASVHCTGVGKAMLSAVPEEVARRLVESSGFRRYTARTITDWESYWKELLEIKRAGYAIDHEEREEGVGCVAVPVFDLSGNVAGAISVSGPSGRILPKVDIISTQVMDGASEISQRLGHTSHFR